MSEAASGKAAPSRLADAAEYGLHAYTHFAPHPQVSRPSRIRSKAEALGRTKLYRFDLDLWAAGDLPGPMPAPDEYGLSLPAPSAAEVLAMAGGGR